MDILAYQGQHSNMKGDGRSKFVSLVNKLKPNIIDLNNARVGISLNTINRKLAILYTNAISS